MVERAKQWALGVCWLCRQTTRVTFIGPLTVNGISAPGFACLDCCDWSLAYVRRWTREQDAQASQAAS